MHDPIGDDPGGRVRVHGLGPAVDPASGTDPAATAHAVDGNEAATRTQPISATEAVSPSAEVRETSSIGAALAAGAIDANAARAQLIDAVVASQLPRGASPALFAAVREQVAAMLADNPHLNDLLRAR